MDIQDLDPIDNNNQDNWPEGTMKVQDVNDAGRADEGLLARWFIDTNGSKITAGTATAYTVSGDRTTSAYYDGLMITAEIHLENTGAATLNLDSLGAADIVKNGGDALEAGDLPAGHIAMFVYRGTDWNLIAVKIGTAGTKDVGTAVGDVVQLEDVGGNAGLPAVDGSQLTGIPANSILQTQRTEKTTSQTITSEIPTDNTIPQQTEGDEVFTVSITPSDTANILEIDVLLNIGFEGSTGGVIASLFQDATADALQTGYGNIANNALMSQVRIYHRMTAGTVSATTFKIRAGKVGTTGYINRRASSDLFGGTLVSSITVRELTV